MSEFQISFTTSAKHVGDILIALHRFKIKDLDLHPVVQKGAKGKPGGAKAWEVLGQIVANSKEPMRFKDMSSALITAGFNGSGISTHVARCVKAGLIRKTPKGYIIKKGGEA